MWGMRQEPTRKERKERGRGRGREGGREGGREVVQRQKFFWGVKSDV